MYAFRLGFVSVLLSDTLVSGFTTGAAIHVLISQIKDLFGLKVPMTKGNFSLIKVRQILQLYIHYHAGYNLIIRYN